MKRLLSVCVLGFALVFGYAKAEPPSQAQLEELLQALGTRQVVEDGMPQMFAQAREVYVERLRSRGADDAEITRFHQVFDAQEQEVRKKLSWQRLQPVLLGVYRESLQAEDAAALIRFFNSKDGKRMLDVLYAANSLESLTQGEVDEAIRRFRASEDGERVIRRMSRLLEIASMEVDPLLEEALGEMTQVLEAEFGRKKP